MNRSIFSVLINLGIEDDQDSNLQLKLKLTNLLALTMMLVLGFYTIVSAFLIPHLITATIFGALAYSIILIFNYIGATNTSRIIISILPSVVTALLHALMTDKDEYLLSVMAFQIVTIFLPLLALRPAERFSLVSAILLNIIIYFNYQSINNIFPIDNPIQETALGLIHVLVSLGSFAFLGLSIYYEQNFFASESLKTKALLADLEEENKRSQEREDALNRSMAELEDSRKIEKQNNWITEGIAKVTELLRQSDDTETLSKEISKFTADYLDVNQVGIYLVEIEDDEPVKKAKINLAGSYAYSKEKRLKKELMAGEGIVGQVYLEKKYVYLDEIPHNYWSITSGMGSAQPKYLLVVPMILDQKVEGIYEIASFHPIEDYKIRFLQRLGESLGASYKTIRINATTKELLAASQEQAEEMRAQEEEMRQNYEELEATQEQMNRLKNDTDALFLNIPGVLYKCKNDENFTMEFISPGIFELTGYRAEEFMAGEVHLTDVFSEDTKKYLIKEIDEKVAWALENNAYISFKYSLQHKNGKITPVIEKGKPIYNQQGEATHFEGIFVRDDDAIESEQNNGK
ncbi:MAG: PAS domain-containing protein [Cyclobacteriaceae bacterium]|nr:PAS domain-containing protein [Cyclobacteriaceae bacterium]MCH8515004.1 PAS domain-containing protein [Cyclobacteriaceae bacterium]